MQHKCILSEHADAVINKLGEIRRPGSGANEKSI